MGRIYTVVASSAQAVAGDILELIAPATGMVKLREVVVTQSASETDDSTEIKIARRVTSGSGGATPTPEPSSLGHAASSVVAEAFNTTDATGTENILWREGISTLAGFSKIWTPDGRPTIPPSGRIVVSFVGDITSATMIVSAEFEELD
jgi:hypothetical protein